MSGGYSVSGDIIGDIRGKKILFFAPAFFDYEKKIAEKMREMGADVDLYDERSVTGARDRALIKIVPQLYTSKSERYYESILSRIGDRSYDYVMFIKCDMTPVSILKKLRTEFPQAKLCLYLYDSVRNIPGIEDKFRYFDILHSFDPEDCRKYRELKFRPLFFADEFRRGPENAETEYDVSFAGTIHTDRYAVIRQIRAIAEEKGLSSYWFCYLQSRFMYYFYRATRKEFAGTSLSDFDLKKKSLKEIADIVEKSRTVIDIQHPRQTGLTMRTIEMIGMNKKLITTNASIRDYDFYDPDNISIVDRKNVQIDDAFLRTPYRPLKKELYEKYSLRSWILEVLS